MTPPPCKIVQIVNSFGHGGAERLVLDLAREIDRTAFEVHLVALHPDLSALDTYGHAGTAVDVFDLSGGYKQRNLHNMWRFLRGLAPHVVHAHMFHSLVGALVGTLGPARPALCWTSHCFDAAFPPLRSAVVRATRGLRSADILFQADQHPRLNARRSVVIGNGVQVPPVPPHRRPWTDSGPVRLIAVGRLADQKDPLGLIRAIHTLDDPRVELDFFGAGPMSEACAALIRNLGLGSRVRLRGISGSIRQEMRNADILVLHSRFEGMPMVVLEAGAEAMPVIATPVGALPSILTNGCGTLAVRTDFAHALAQLIAAPEKAITDGRRFYDQVSARYSISAVARAHEALYASLAQHGTRSQHDNKGA